MRACLACEEPTETDFCPDCGEETEPCIECHECGEFNLEGNYDCFSCDARIWEI